jgi:hypothetical protein
MLADLTCLRRFSYMVLILEFIFTLVSLVFETASQVEWTSFATNSVFSIVLFVVFRTNQYSL